MIGDGLTLFRGQLRLSEETNSEIAETNKYQKISGTFTDGESSGFKVENNKLIYTGPSGVCFLFNGTSDLSSNKACEISYALFVNGLLVTEAQTPHTFPSSSRTETIAITSIVKLNKDDEIEIFCKSDTISTILTVRSLIITLWS